MKIEVSLEIEDWTILLVRFPQNMQEHTLVKSKRLVTSLLLLTLDSEKAIELSGIQYVTVHLA